MTALKKIRTKKMIAQGGRCFYCGLPMWDEVSGLSLPESLAGLKAVLRCTAEHLQARCDGGRDVADNIVAACHYCNAARHRSKRPKPPEQYRAHVRRRMAQGRWLAGQIAGGARAR